jgi:hypothetical protein
MTGWHQGIFRPVTHWVPPDQRVYVINHVAYTFATCGATTYPESLPPEPGARNPLITCPRCRAKTS